MVQFESTNKFKEGLIDSRHSNKSLITTGGDSNQIEFIYLEQKASEEEDNDSKEEKTKNKESSDEQQQQQKSLPFGIEIVESVKLDHGFKINCLKYASTSATLYVSDTTRNLTIYDFNDSCFL